MTQYGRNRDIETSVKPFQAPPRFGYWILDTVNLTVLLSKTSALLFSLQASQRFELNVFLELVTEADREPLKRYIIGIVEGRESTLEATFRARDGILPLRIRAELNPENSEYSGIIYKSGETNPEDSDQVLINRKIFDRNQDAILVSDSSNVIIDVNRAFEIITGFPRDEIIGKTPRVLKSGKHDSLFYHEMWKAIENSGEWSGEIWDRRKNGEMYPKWLNIYTVPNKRDVHYYVAMFTDLSKARETNQKIEFLAHYNPITELPNLNMLMQRLPENMKFASRDRHMLAVLYFDIDRFKNINETKGFEIGNVILKEIARRVRSQLRETDAVYHIGGDEFIIIMNFVTTLRAVSLKADLLRQISSEPITAAGEEFYLSVSIGISIYPDDASDHQDLLNCANIALGHAKTEGKNNFQFFSENLNNKIKQKLTIENRLRKALDRNELEVFYQPRVKTKTGEISGMEALLRWNSPDLGSISPAVFIPLAEESDLINNIGEWTLFTACNHMVRWQKEVHNPIRLSVNFSVRQFHDPSILSMVKGVLDFTKYNPQNLEIEITESFFLEFQDEMLQILYRLKNLGIKISIDDFGTGYSSLNYLKRFPVDVIKIDRSFIKDIGKDGEAESIVSAILAMALQLGISVTAEGVETPEQLAFLQKHNCEEVQGYLFSSPLDFINFKKYIDSPLSSRSHPH